MKIVKQISCAIMNWTAILSAPLWAGFALMWIWFHGLVTGDKDVRRLAAGKSMVWKEIP